MNVKEFKEKQYSELKSKLNNLLNIDTITDKVINEIFSTIEDYDEKIFYDVVMEIAGESDKFPDNFINHFINSIENDDNITKFKMEIDRGGYGNHIYTFFGFLRKGKQKLPNKIKVPDDIKKFCERIRFIVFHDTYNEFGFSDKVISVVGIDLRNIGNDMTLAQFTEFIEFGSTLSTMKTFFELFRLEKDTKFSQRNYNYYFERFFEDGDESLVKLFSAASQGKCKFLN